MREEKAKREKRRELNIAQRGIRERRSMEGMRLGAKAQKEIRDKY